VVSQAYAQLTHSISLSDVCDSLQRHSGPLARIRGATAPSRNGFSNANRERPAAVAEGLFFKGVSPAPGLVPGWRSVSSPAAAGGRPGTTGLMQE